MSIGIYTDYISSTEFTNTSNKLNELDIVFKVEECVAYGNKHNYIYTFNSKEDLTLAKLTVFKNVS